MKRRKFLISFVSPKDSLQLHCSGTSRGSALQKPDLAILDFAALEQDSEPEAE